jgi:tetratricopeptide (TPR) repeat protein
MGGLLPFATFSDPDSKQPVSALFTSETPWKGRRHLHLWYVYELVGVPERAASAGRWKEALEDYEWLVRFLPTSMRIRTGLGETLLRLGRAREAIPHLEYALSCRVDEPTRLAIEGALIRARRVAPGVLQ